MYNILLFYFKITVYSNCLNAWMNFVLESLILYEMLNFAKHLNLPINVTAIVVEMRSQWL